MKVFKWFVITIGSALLILFTIVLISQGKVILPASISDYFITLTDSIFNSKFITTDMFLPTTILFSFGISLLIYLLINKFNAYLTIYFVISLLFAVLIIGDYKLKFIYFQLFVFTALSMYIEKYYLNKAEEDSMKIKLQFLIPTFLVFSIFMTGVSSFVAHLKTDPVDFVDTIIDGINNIHIRGVGRNNEVISYSTETAYSQGFSSFNDTIVMIVDAPSQYHLRGLTYDYYDGENWKRSDELDQQDTRIIIGNVFFSKDLVEIIANTGYLVENRSFDFGNIDNLDYKELLTFADNTFDKVSVSITYSNLRTKALFLPENTFGISPTTDQELSFNTFTGSTLSDITLTKNFYYTATAYIQKFSRNMTDKLREVGNSPNAHDPDNVDAYLQIPSSVPQRVFDLAKEVTDQYTNDYDRARALERYLSQNYKYSLQVDLTPSDRDFVDYFLFDQPTGYCTYYASSMVIMARSLGIPARYARGYVMPEKQSLEDLIDTVGGIAGLIDEGLDTIYQITENQSHAWPEIYIRGYGWMSFEPTAPYYSSYLPQNYDPYIYDVPDKDPLDNTPEVNAPNDITSLSKLFIIILLSILVLIPFVLLIIKRIKYSRYDSKTKVILIFKKTVELFKISQYKFLPYDTARTYSEKVDKTFDLSKSKFEEVILIFEKARYGKEKISVRELSLVEDYFVIAKGYLISSVSIFKKIRLKFTTRL